MIRIEGPFDIREEGSCNACQSQIDAQGNRFGTVYMIHVGITTTRVCPRCLWILSAELDALRYSQALTGVTSADHIDISIGYSGNIRMEDKHADD